MFDIHTAFDVVRSFILSQGDAVCARQSEVSIATSKDGGRDMATNFDIEIEQAFSDLVQQHYPDHGFVGEECEDLVRDGEYIWDIDAIDGTRYFIAGVPLWSICISLRHDEDTLLACVYNPASKQLYSALRGEGAYLNGEQIFVSQETDISRITVDFLFGKLFLEQCSDLPDADTLLHRLGEKCYGVRVVNSSALTLSWLAQGYFGAFVCLYRKPEKMVDIRAGLLIAQEAGASIYHEELPGGYHRHIVGNAEVIEQLREVIGV